MNNKKQRLIDLLMPGPLGWLLTGTVFLLAFVNPYHIIDRVFDLMDKGVGYRIAITVVAFAISAPFYLRLRKKLHKYEEDEWKA